MNDNSGHYMCTQSKQQVSDIVYGVDKLETRSFESIMN